ncbi:MAG: hypothetical protein KC657_09515 [Myxococcales bacterium]|nr:hypothetical protein [Myxococcales bacterium]
MPALALRPPASLATRDDEPPPSIRAALASSPPASGPRARRSTDELAAVPAPAVAASGE